MDGGSGRVLSWVCRSCGLFSPNFVVDGNETKAFFQSMILVPLLVEDQDPADCQIEENIENSLHDNLRQSMRKTQRCLL